MKHNTNPQKLSTNYKILIALFVVAVSLFVYSKKTSAQNIIPLVVAPARQTLEADPGKIASFAVRFYNTGTEPISGTFKVADFIVDNNDGSPSFLEGPTTLSNRYAAAQWVSLSTEKGTIPAAGMVIIDGKIRIPSNANPGGKYFAVFFEPTSNVPEASGARQEEAASVSMRIAGLVYLRVSGPVAEGANIVSFSAPGFSEYGPVAITTEIKNSGDYHITPKGQVSVKNMFGAEVAKVELSETNIFPDASRTIVSKLGTKWMVGKFTASFDATYGESGKALTANLNFWVFPWKVAIVTLLGIIIIILIIIIITNRFTKKEKKLEEELTEEKEELEKLKETLKDKISELAPSSKDESSLNK